MCVAAGAIAGSAVLGAVASNSAANTEASAANNAANLTNDQFQQTQANSAPWRAAGQNALSTIASMQPQFTHTFDASDLNSNLAPNYAFQLQQGQAANQNAAGVAGGLVGGNALKGLQDYTQNAAGNAYQQAFNNYNAQQTNIYNRLSNLAGLGQIANQTVANAGSNAVNAESGLLTSGASAQAAGQIGVANAATNGLGSYLGWSSSPSATAANGSFGGPLASIAGGEE